MAGVQKGNSSKKMKRKSNFTSKEIDVLLGNVKKHYKILYGQNAKQYNSRHLRYRTWLDIVKKVNEVGNEKRTLQEIKNKWKKCQYALKDKAGGGAVGDFDTVNMKTKHKNKTRRLKVRTVSSYDPDFKKAVILYAEEKSTSEAKKLYGVSESNIRRWRKMKNEIYDKSEKKTKLNLVKRRSSTRNSPRMSYSLEPTEHVPADPLDTQDSLSIDSMPLQQRMSHSPEDSSSSSQPVLQSQPLSPTKLKVTRQSVKAAASTSTPPPPPKLEPPKQPPNEEVCLRWNSHHSNMQTAFPSLLLREQYVDVTLVAAEGQTLKCHRLILSSCSSYFEDILQGITPYQHPVLFMKDIPFWILKSLCDFMYCGEVQIYQSKLQELLAVAEGLKIKGLAGKSPVNEQDNTSKDDKKVSKTEKITESSSKSNKSDKYNNKSHEEEVDPLDLLEPLYEEVEEKKPSLLKLKETKNVSVKKSVPKKIKKRKYSDHEPSPPPVFHFRKGTRSRPNVKIPKYYHHDYGKKEEVPHAEELTEEQPSTSSADPLFEISEIKAEPIDIEDNIILYSDDEPMLQPVSQEDDSISNFENSADGTVADKTGNNADGVDVTEHSLAEDSSIVEGNSQEREANPLNVPLPQDESTSLESSLHLEETNSLETDNLLEMANPLDTSSIIGAEDVIDESKLEDDNTDDGFGDFKKINLMTQPIITEVRSLSDDICGGNEMEISNSHMATSKDNAAEMEIDPEEFSEPKDPLNISGDTLPHIETDTNISQQSETTETHKDSELPCSSQDKDVDKDLQEIVMMFDDSQGPNSVEQVLESPEKASQFESLDAPTLESSEKPLENMPEFKAIEDLQDLSEISKPPSPERSTDDNIGNFTQNNYLETSSQKIDFENHENLNRNLEEAAEKQSSERIEENTDQISDQSSVYANEMPVLQPAELEKINEDTGIPPPNIMTLENTLLDTDVPTVDDPNMDFVNQIEPDTSENMTVMKDDADNMFAAVNLPKDDGSITDIDQIDSNTPDDIDVLKDDIEDTFVENTFGDANIPKDDDPNMDVISEIEKTIELLNEIGNSRNLSQESAFDNTSEMQNIDERQCVELQHRETPDINEGAYDDLQPDQMVNDDFENVNLSDATDSNIFSLDPQTVDPIQSEEDLLADT